LKKKFFLDSKSVKADGSFKAIIATMGVVDKDGDVTKPGFFGKQGVVVVPVHDWNHVPIGKATITEEGDKAVAEGKVNMDIQSAKDWFSAMKFDLENGDPLMEWSYGFKVLEGGSSVGELAGTRCATSSRCPTARRGARSTSARPCWWAPARRPAPSWPRRPRAKGNDSVTRSSRCLTPWRRSELAGSRLPTSALRKAAR
jgi:hypothetical protein